jgi:hypothetical protein
VRLKVYARDGNFQRFHFARVAEREALAQGRKEGRKAN